ncbi:sensor histidine kinase [Nitrosophilus labii]|uniref:sensor histidine kinase n=1 Tax=Nitrosophilus labii TaxID=2706014 RepID=UPI001656FB1C|nr:HAMP domain-containing sensor histidine kinase [Nitrosophilus labii]
MSLSHYEKRSLFRFMSVYIGSIFLVIVGFGILFYKIETEAYKEKVFNKLRIEAFKIASSAIDAHMRHKDFIIPKKSDFMLLDKNKQFIDGTFKEEVDIKKEFFVKNGSAYYVDKGAKGHLGINYIVVKDKDFEKHLKSIFRKTIFISLFAFIFLMSVGWYLGKLFLKPMKEKIKELDRFIKDSTHELNTPVTSILLATQKIEQKGEKPTYIKTLKMSSKLISKIYQDMSFISFNQHSKCEKKLVDISKKLDNSLDFFALLIEQKDLKIKKEVNPCHIEADPNHIDILIKNLVDNAIKYAKPNSIITVTLKNCTLSVTNEGKTIKSDKLSQIFKRYERDDETTGGFGIGLDIVSTICKKYGFKIDVISKNNITTFKVDFLS